MPVERLRGVAAIEQLDEVVREGRAGVAAPAVDLADHDQARAWVRAWASALGWDSASVSESVQGWGSVSGRRPASAWEWASPPGSA